MIIELDKATKRYINLDNVEYTEEMMNSMGRPTFKVWFKSGNYKEYLEPKEISKIITALKKGES